MHYLYWNAQQLYYFGFLLTSHSYTGCKLTSGVQNFVLKISGVSLV